MYLRNETRKIKVGSLTLGGDSPVRVQSMLNKLSRDIEGCVDQAKLLERAGCDIIRAAVPNMEAVPLITALKNAVGMPVVADIHFDYRLAVESVRAGADKIRINPGNIGGDENVKAVASACRSAGVPIRIGINSGSLPEKILQKYGSPTPEALVEAAEYHAKLLEKFDFEDIVISIKSSDTVNMYKANVLAAERFQYPLHLGVTEAGTLKAGTIRSSAGIGGLLLRGIGNTIRVSLTDDPINEIYTACDILKACGLMSGGVKIISCPTCGRTEIDLISLAQRVENATADCNKNITVAIMGCVVNGPGEAREADIGVAGGKGCGIIFRKGKPVRKVDEDDIVPALLEEIEKL